MTAPDRRPPASPCVGICVIDAARGLCTGCARTLDEIAAWASATDAFRAAVWAALPARAAAMGLAIRRLDWRGGRLLDAIAARLAEAAGTLVAGVHGAVAEVCRDPGEAFSLTCADGVLTFATARAALRLTAPSFMTVFEIARPERAPIIPLAVPVGRAGPPGPAGLTDLGPDPAALLPRDAGGRRFDMGLGRRAGRFTIRCAPDLAQAIAPHCGTSFPASLAAIGGPVLGASPVQVIETPHLRAEVDSPIPPPGGVSPPGPHTHLLPDHIAQGFDTPPTVPLPAGHVLTALFHPG